MQARAASFFFESMCNAVLCPNDGVAMSCDNCEVSYCSESCMRKDAKRHECGKPLTGLRSYRTFAYIFSHYADVLCQMISIFDSNGTKNAKLQKDASFQFDEIYSLVKSVRPNIRYGTLADLENAAKELRDAFSAMHDRLWLSVEGKADPRFKMSDFEPLIDALIQYAFEGAKYLAIHRRALAQNLMGPLEDIIVDSTSKQDVVASFYAFGAWVDKKLELANRQ